MATSRKSRFTALQKIAPPIVIILIAVISALYMVKAHFGRNELATGRAQVQVDKVLPNLNLTRLDGQRVQLSEFNAKVLMVNFWATWCEACMVEMPSIVQLRNKYHSQGFEVLGINLDENSELVAPKVARREKIDFPLFKDPDGKIAEFFDVRAIPLTIMIDRQKKVLQIIDGEQNWFSPDVQTQLERWLSG